MHHPYRVVVHLVHALRLSHQCTMLHLVHRGALVHRYLQKIAGVLRPWPPVHRPRQPRRAHQCTAATRTVSPSTTRKPA